MYRFLIMLVFLSPFLAHADDNWPQFRGPNQTGIANAKGLPDEWSETKNIVWKTALPSWSGSSPVIWGDRVFLMSPSKSEKPGGSPGGPKILLLCLSKHDGNVLWEREIDAVNGQHLKQNNSSPTPVTDGAHVWVATGSGTIAGLTMDGEVVWKLNLQEKYGPFAMQFDNASSPLLADGKILFQVLQGFKREAPSYLVAFDALSGKESWKTERPTDAIQESHDSYGTPAVLDWEGKKQIVISGGDYVTGHDVETGKEIWRGGGLNPKGSTKNRIIVSPVCADGMIYAVSSHKPLLALRAGGAGNVTTSHLAWKWDAGDGPDVPTPACDGKHLYLFNDHGVVTCFDAKTGEIIWGPERTAPGIVSASPIVADGKIYITNEAGVTTVLAAGSKFKLIATNTLESEGKTLSSIAVSGNQLFLRSPTHLYCIGK